MDDIFEPTIKIKIPKSLFDRLNLGTFNITELKLHLADSTYKLASGIKENIVVQIKDSPVLIDLVVVGMREDRIVSTILGRPFLRTVKALINVHEGNVRFELPS